MARAGASKAAGKVAARRKPAGGAPVKVRLICVSDEERDLLLAEAADYLARTGTRWGASLQLVKPARRSKGADDDKVRLEEAERLLGASEGCFRLALDVKGRTFTSEALSAHFEDVLARGRPIALLIGGPTGLHASLLSAVEEKVSLSALTLPHRLAVLVAAEQIYRAHEIARGGPYHKA